MTYNKEKDKKTKAAFDINSAIKRLTNVKNNYCGNGKGGQCGNIDLENAMTNVAQTKQSYKKRLNAKEKEELYKANPWLPKFNRKHITMDSNGQIKFGQAHKK